MGLRHDLHGRLNNTIAVFKNKISINAEHEQLLLWRLSKLV